MFQVSESHFVKVLINRFRHLPDAVEVTRTFTDFWRPRMPVFLPNWIRGTHTRSATNAESTIYFGAASGMKFLSSFALRFCSPWMECNVTGSGVMVESSKARM
jgi:hypothetical protein